MQLCTIYKSSKKAETYLYVEKTDDFSKVPEQLMSLIGTPILVMTFDLDSRKSLAMADINKVKSELLEQGFYLQLAPPQENLLDEFKKQTGYQEPDKK